LLRWISLIGRCAGSVNVESTTLMTVVPRPSVGQGRSRGSRIPCAAAHSSPKTYQYSIHSNSQTLLITILALKQELRHHTNRKVGGTCRPVGLLFLIGTGFPPAPISRRRSVQNNGRRDIHEKQSRRKSRNGQSERYGFETSPTSPQSPSSSQSQERQEDVF
jgi:hypothetical protein